MKFLRCYLDEKEPTLKNFAEVVRSLESRCEASSEGDAELAAIDARGELGSPGPS